MINWLGLFRYFEIWPEIVRLVGEMNFHILLSPRDMEHQCNRVTSN